MLKRDLLITNQPFGLLRQRSKPPSIDLATTWPDCSSISSVTVGCGGRLFILRRAIEVAFGFARIRHFEPVHMTQ
jgi:hypothetical protein